MGQKVCNVMIMEIVSVRKVLILVLILKMGENVIAAFKIIMDFQIAKVDNRNNMLDRTIKCMMNF